MKREEYKSERKKIKIDEQKKIKDIKELSDLTKKEKEKQIFITIENSNNQYKVLKTKYYKSNPLERERQFKRLFMALLCLVVLFSVYKVSNIILNNGTFNNYDDYTHLNSKDFFKQEDENYYVYAYYPNCGACNSIKKDVFEYANNGPIQLYLFDVKGKTYSFMYKEGSSVGADDFYDLRIYSTPTLLEIKNNKVTKQITGADSVLEFLRGY